MASAADYRRRDDTHYSVHPSSHRDHDLEPDLVPSSSSSSGSSSKSSRRADLQRQMDELDQQARASHGGQYDDIPHHPHRRSSAAGRGSDEDMIHRGADIVRAQLHADSSRREAESVHRGASIVREQIMRSQNGGGMHPASSESASPRGVSSPFGAGAGEYGDVRPRSHDMHESKRVLEEEVDELSDRLRYSVGFDREERRQAENSGMKASDSSVTSSKHRYKGSDSSVTSSKHHNRGSDSSMSSSKYHYPFDPFADDDGDDNRMSPPPAIPEGSETNGTFMAGRDKSIKFKVEDDGRQEAYESVLYEDSSQPNRSSVGNEHSSQNGNGYRQHQREQVVPYRETSVQYGQQMMPAERPQPGCSQELRQSRPTSRPRSRSDKAYEHAMKSGVLWQTLVGEHVRFPKDWWGGARTPTLGDPSCEPSKWQYISRHRVRGNEMLNGWVRNRTSAGRVLLHVIVSDGVTGPIQDVAIGCFHPNARGVRRTPRPIADDDNVREIWMAIRKRERSGRDRHDALSASLLNTALTLGHGIEDVGQPSPLGERYSVTNDNMRAVFGDKAPISTYDVPSQELYKIIIDAVEESRFRGQASPYPARTLLQEFLFTKRR